MFDIGVTKLAIVGGIALIVIGPDKLPGLAKTLGALLGRARRYVADVKEEVNRSMDLDALKKMKEAVEGAGNTEGRGEVELPFDDAQIGGLLRGCAEQLVLAAHRLF